MIENVVHSGSDRLPYIDLKFAQPKNLESSDKNDFAIKQYDKFFSFNEEDYIKTLVIYDTNYENTKKIAEAVTSKLGKEMSRFLASLKANELKGIKATSFDTRMKLFFFINAAKKISKELTRAGAVIIAMPQDFLCIKN